VHNAPTPPADDLPKDEIKLAGAIVAGFVSTRPWLREERDDLVQECLEHWLCQRARYAALRGAALSTFMRRVLEHHLLDLDERRFAQKRGGGQSPDSLDAEGEGGISLYDITASNQDTAQAATFNLGLARALSKLTPEQRVLTEALNSGQTMVEAARAADRARSSLYRDLERIRDVFREEGLDEFL
jgi:RNA polymerase sigma-70 factor (ECF subfamily)